MPHNRPEDAIQRAVFDHIRRRGKPGLIAWHTPNGGRRGRVEAAILKGLGVLPGVSDVCAQYDGRFYALELKAPGCRPTEAQLKFIDGVNSQGGFACWVDSLDRALRVLETWGLLNGRAALGADYDALDDITKSVGVGLRAIRDRKAAGGPGWKGHE